MTGVALLVVVIALVVISALIGLIAVRKLVPRTRLSQHTDVAGYVYAVIGVIYGVILAQVVVAAWDEYREARDVTVAEASSILNLDRLARTWPDPAPEEIRAALVGYAREVVTVEWPAMNSGDYSLANSSTQMPRLWDAYDAAAQGSAGATANYMASLEELDDLNDARRARFLLGERGLPQTMTFTLLLGGIITVGFSYLFAVEDRWLHGLMTASLALLVALLLMLEFQLETPFEGIDAIKPTAMELVLESLENDS
jgi:hypothetical protein